LSTEKTTAEDEENQQDSIPGLCRSKAFRFPRDKNRETWYKQGREKFIAVSSRGMRNMELSASLSESVTVMPFRDESDTWEIAVLLPEPEARNRVQLLHPCWRALLARFFVVLSGRI